MAHEMGHVLLPPRTLAGGIMAADLNLRAAASRSFFQMGAGKGRDDRNKLYKEVWTAGCARSRLTDKNSRNPCQKPVRRGGATAMLFEIPRYTGCDPV